jgi:hypothetical protein
MKKYLIIAVAFVSLAVPASAFALDGCKVLLCLAGNWRHIQTCVPPVKQALRDLALGRSYPQCDMNNSGPTGNTNDGIARADSMPTTQATCPPMYSIYSQENSNWIGCAYPGVITVVVDGAPWTDTFWDTAGKTSTYYYAPARAALTTIDPTYDNDLAAYLQSQPPAPAPPTEGT